MALADVLTNLGFTEQSVDEFQALGDDLDLSRNDNPYKVKAVYTNGGVTALVEQNVSEDNSGGVDVVMKHPAVLILESNKGRVAIPNFDDNPSLIADIVRDLT